VAGVQLTLPYSEITRAPVIWSHSASRHFNNISRNVPDYILKHIGSGKGQKDGVVMVNIYPAFMLPEKRQDEADVRTVADHVEWMAG
jgi:membrane dipeptidase